MNRNRLVHALAAGLTAALELFWAGPAHALQCQAGTLEHYQSGTFKGCVIEARHEYTVADGVLLRCRAGTRVTLHEQGGIASCVADEDVRTGRTRCPAGNLVFLDREGRVSACAAE